MNVNIAALLYLVSGALFILALRGLASPETARTGNRRGMIGMGLAILTTLAVTGVNDVLTWVLVLGGLGIGGAVGAGVARRIAMTAMPQLVAAFHSLVGLAAVLVAGAALYSPDAYGICVHDAANMCTGIIKTQSLIEMSLGVAIGAITFTGSVIAFAKLNGNMSGAPILLPARHLLNIAIAVAIVALVVVLVMSGRGYGMAVSQAQHALREMADKLKEEGVEVKYAIHPVAGRKPGHMNVLLAEA